MKVETNGFHHLKEQLELILENIIRLTAVNSGLYTGTRSTRDVLRQGWMRRAACLCTVQTPLLPTGLHRTKLSCSFEWWKLLVSIFLRLRAIPPSPLLLTDTRQGGSRDRWRANQFLKHVIFYIARPVFKLSFECWKPLVSIFLSLACGGGY